MAKAKHDWAKLDPRIDTLKAQGWSNTEIARDLGISRQTLVDHLRLRESAHLGTPESNNIAEIPQDIPEHPGTLEGYQEVLEEIVESVPEVAPLITDEVHPSTPEVLPEVSVNDSTTAHSGVPAWQLVAVRHIALIDQYAQEHHVDLKQVLFLALEEFFQRRGYLNK